MRGCIYRFSHCVGSCLHKVRESSLQDICEFHQVFRKLSEGESAAGDTRVSMLPVVQDPLPKHFF